MTICKDDYWLVKKRRTPTLVRWWKTLNSWEWPKEIPNEPLVRDDPRRGELMKQIAAEIGQRYIIKGKLQEPTT